MEETIFEACIDPALEGLDHNGTGTDADYRSIARDLVRRAIQAIIDRTPSPATVVELTRILREGGVEVTEATFD